MPDDTSLIDPHLKELWDRKATDLLISVGSVPLIRIDGALHPLEDARPLDADTVDSILQSLIGVESMATFALDREIDFSFSWGSQARIRGNVFHESGHVAMALRLIPNRIPGFDELGVVPVIQELCKLPQGLVLVTGPTGSGKSTTLAAMIDAINHDRACHILTIEDPIEYVHERALCAIHQREVGVDTLSFARALRSAFREDPDVLLVGEMRDNETIAAALTLAETGHLVFATLHTNDASQTVDRIVDVFPAEQQGQIRLQLAGSVQAIISQRLIPRIGGGRLAAFEVLIATYAVRNMIRDGRTNQLRNVIATGSQDGMQTLEASLTKLVANGLVTHEEAITHTLMPTEVRTLATT